MVDTPGPFAASDLNAVSTTLNSINEAAGKASKALIDGFAKAVVSGKSFDQTLQGIVKSLSTMALKSASSPLQQGFTQLLQQGVGALAGGLGGAGAVEIGRAHV